MQAEAIAQMRRRVVISSTIGNALEWFDFTVFGLFASVLSKLFFPADNPSSSLLLTFATFGIAFAARPLGGLVFGLYADRHGRKKALVVMISLMAVGAARLPADLWRDRHRSAAAVAAGALDPGLFRRRRILQRQRPADRIR